MPPDRAHRRSPRPPCLTRTPTANADLLMLASVGLAQRAHAWRTRSSPECHLLSANQSRQRPTRGSLDSLTFLKRRERRSRHVHPRCRNQYEVACISTYISKIELGRSEREQVREQPCQRDAVRLYHCINIKLPQLLRHRLIVSTWLPVAVRGCFYVLAQLVIVKSHIAMLDC